MAAEETTRTLSGFWSTLPGIFTGIAAVITAVGGILIAVRESPTSPTTTDIAVSTTNTTTITTDTVLETPTASPGAVPDSVLIAGQGDLEAEEIAEVDWQTAALQSAAETCATTEDSSACTFLFDTLASQCYLEDMVSCDLLFELSPMNSDYEAYGETCGYRFGADYAGVCALLADSY